MKVTHLNDCTCCDRHVTCATNTGSPDILTTKDPSEVTCRRCPGTVRYSRYVERMERARALAEFAPVVGSTWITNGSVISTITEVTPGGMVRANAYDPQGHRRGREWDMTSWKYARDNGYTWPAPEGTEPVEAFPVITMRRTHPSSVAATESTDFFTIKGPGVYNPLHSHRVVGFTGRCCDLRTVHLHMSAGPIVVAPGHRPPPSIPLRAGGVVIIEYQEYRIVARRMADPVLIPLGWEELA